MTIATMDAEHFVARAVRAPLCNFLLPGNACVKIPCSGTSGYWWASTARGNGSISEKASGRKPKGSQATVAASIPELTER
jgi:hypothetical protein